MKLSFSAQMIIGSLIGIVVGAVLGKDTIHVKILGDIFINLITMMVPFLIFGALLESVMTLDIKDFGSVGAKTLLSFVITGVASGALAIGCGYFFQPGAGITGIQLSAYKGNATGMTASEAILSFFPKNIFTAFNTNQIAQIILFAVIVGIAISYYKSQDPIKRVHDSVLDLNVLVMKIVTLIMSFAPFGIFS